MSVDVLEELRMITNLICGSQQQIRLVVAGTRALEEKLLHPQMESFNQRISTRCYMQPMTRTETMYYALTQMQACGRDGRDVFLPSALDRVHDITNGVLRLAAQLCDHVLKQSALAQSETIDASMVQRAWSDLQQLPIEEEVVGFATTEQESGIIEFGNLDDGSVSTFETSSSSEPVAPTAEQQESAVFDTDEQFDNQIEDVQDDVVSIESYREEPAETRETNGPSLMKFPESEDNDTHSGLVAPPVENAVPRVDSTLDKLLQQIDEIENPTESGLAVTPSPLDDVEPKTDDYSEELVENSVSSPTADSTATSSEPAELTADNSVSTALDPNRVESLAQAIASAHALSDLQYQTEQQGIGDRVDLADAARQQRSSRVEPSAEDIFGETFDDEEHVDEVQNAAVADQNRASSGLTSEELASLKPRESVDEEIISQPAFNEPLPTPQSFITPSFENEPAAETHDTGSRKTEPEASLSQVEIVAPSNNNSYDEVTLSPESREQSAAHETKPIQENSAFELPNVAGGHVATELSQPESSAASPSRGTPESPVAELPVDDSDMLIAAPVQPSIIEPTAQTNSPSDPIAEQKPEAPPQGQVIRMNYQELFQQLRSQTPGSET